MSNRRGLRKALGRIFHSRSTSPDHSPSVPSLPVLYPGHPTTADSNESSVDNLALALDNVALGLDIAEKLAGFIQTVPFIAPAAGFLSQIVKAYKEVKDTNDKRDALLDRITGIAEDLYSTILQMEAMRHLDLIHRLEPDIETYTTLLEKAAKFITEYEGLGGLRRAAARNQLGVRFSVLQQELDSFGARFRTNRLVDLAMQGSTIKETLEKVHDMAVEKKLEEWLRSPPDMRQKQHDTQKLHKEGTGRWLLAGNVFIEWQDNPGSLWIQGPSGSGKSVLSSTVIRQLIDDQQLFKDSGKSSAIAFFYFDFKTKEGQNVEAALRRIVLQLSAQSPHPYSVLQRQYNLSKGQTLPNYRDLRRVLGDLLLGLGRTYIVLDALDECQDTELEQLLSLISMLRGWTSSPLHLLVTSQHRASFSDEFKDMPTIFLQSDVVQADIRLFISSELRNNRKMKAWASRADEIVDRVLMKSSGMFRFAACLLVELSRCKRQNELDKTLEDLPDDLFGIYDRFLEIIRPKDLVYVTGVLRWLVYSRGFLSLTRLADALAFDFSDEAHYTYDPSLRGDNVNAIPDWFEGLATVQYDEGLVLDHGSVQDYVLSRRFTEKFGFDLSPGPSHTFIARTCLGYLLQFSDHPFQPETYRDEYPLAPYAAQHWCQHILNCHDQTALVSDAMHLLEDGSQQYIALNHLRNNYYGSSFPERRFLPTPPLHLCVTERYIDGMRGLLLNGADVNMQSAEGTALHVASASGHMDITLFLLENGADANIPGEGGYPALSVALDHGCTEIACLLLDHGADPNARAVKSGSVLHDACIGEYPDVVRRLLAKGADVDARDGEYETVLQTAARYSDTYIVQLLLENGADINALCGPNGTALQIASWRGHTEIARFLVDNGADVSAEPGPHGSALQAACSNASPDIVQLILNKGADSNAQHGPHGSPLQIASWRGHMEIIRLLLDHGADANAQERQHGTALQAACGGMMDHPEVVQLLLANGADINATGGRNGSALQIASWRGHIESTRFLLNNGADANAEPGPHGSALHAACTRASPDLVQLLLENGADSNARSGPHGSALQIASWRGHMEIIRLLLDHGADANAQEGQYGTALQAACSSIKGHRDVVQLLLKNGADINARGGRQGTALQAACLEAHLDLVQLLLENGADVNAQPGPYGAALQAACFGCMRHDPHIVRLLLKNGGDVNAQGGRYGSALQAACAKAQPDIIQLLLANGADTNAQDGVHGSALQIASRRGDEKIIRLLRDNGAAIDGEGKPDRSGFQTASTGIRNSAHTDIAELIAKGADVDARDEQDETVLQVASRKGGTEIVRLLLASGADANARAGPHGTALQAACSSDHTDIVQLLLANGADVSGTGGYIATALQLASWYGYTECVKLLLASGADVNAPCEKYRTPLQNASRNGHTEVVQLLLASGADVRAQGERALEAASRRSRTQIVRLLEERGAVASDSLDGSSDSGSESD